MRLIVLSIICSISIVPNACIPIQDATKETNLLTYQSTSITSNQRMFSYDLADGQRRSETVTITNVSHPEDGKNEVSVHGSFSFNGSDGKLYLVEYVADRNGYQSKIMIYESKPMIGISVNGIDDDSLLSGQVLKSLVG